MSLHIAHTVLINDISNAIKKNRVNKYDKFISFSLSFFLLSTFDLSSSLSLSPFHSLNLFFFLLFFLFFLSIFLSIALLYFYFEHLFIFSYLFFIFFFYFILFYLSQTFLFLITKNSFDQCFKSLKNERKRKSLNSIFSTLNNYSIISK